MKQSLITGKKLQILLHIVVWIILIILPQYLVNNYLGGNVFFTLGFYITAAIYGLIFYLNYLWLAPKLFLRGKRIGYFVSAAAVIVCFYFIMDFGIKQLINTQQQRDRFEENFERPPEVNERPRPPYRQFHIYNYTIMTLLITGFSLGMSVLDKLALNEKQRKELEKEKLNSELAFLKNQVSPHFFFNTLNNIYSLITINTTNAQQSVLKLSKLMRYLLYESEQGKTQLSQEIDFMNNYIDLMKLRLSEKVKLNVSFPKDFNDLLIPPLLFIPFIENAFKHGITYREKSFIDISMEVTDNTILFLCNNSLAKTTEELVNQYPGIGLENIKKRLSLLFPGRHQLKINQTKQSFDVFLKINIEGLSV